MIALQRFHLYVNVDPKQVNRLIEDNDAMSYVKISVMTFDEANIFFLTLKMILIENFHSEYIYFYRMHIERLNKQKQCTNLT